MNTQNIKYYAIALVLLVGGGIYFFMSTQRASLPEDTSQMSPAVSTEKEGSVLGDSSGAEKNTEEDLSSVGSSACVRNFDSKKLELEKVDLTNTKVEFDVVRFGKFQVELYPKDAPKTVENFLRLVNSNFYNCLTFHRVSKGFVIQGGDPKGDGTGGISAFGGEFADELNPETPSYKEGYKHGVLAMANRGPNTNSSQFFILLSNYPLDHKYTIFGKVTSGLPVVDSIGQVEIVPGMFGPTDGSPKEKVIINKASIIK